MLAVPSSGASYVFEKPPGGWTSGCEKAILTATDGADRDVLGFAVGVSGTTVAAGAPGKEGTRGAAYVFRESAVSQLAPNPSFETRFGGSVRNWFGFGGGLVRDSSVAHTGSASVLLDVTATGGAQSECITPTGSGAYTSSIWCRISDPTATLLEQSVTFYGTADCSGVLASPTLTTTPIVYTSWHFFGGTVTAPAGTGSARIRFTVTRTATGPTDSPAAGVNLDDAGLAPSTTTSVQLQLLGARRNRQGVVISWRGGSSTTLGFHIYRQRGAKRVRLNRRLLAALAGRSGRVYTYADRSLPHAARATYWVEAVDVNGNRRSNGPARLAPARRTT